MISKPKYMVMNENALGYIYPEQPKIFNILASSVIRGGPSPMNGWTYISEGFDELRPASIADFSNYRVCHKYHIED